MITDHTGTLKKNFNEIYTGCHQTPDQIVAAAIQEDVDLVGLKKWKR